MIDFFQNLHWGVLFQIIMIDILLGGDNAVVIALACRKLDARQRVRGIIWGTFGAIAMRVVLIFFALQLLSIPMLKVVGALLLVWIGIKLLQPDEGHHEINAGSSLWAAVKTILIADFVMSLDNVLAIAGAAQSAATDHQLGYVIFGLLLSVPIIIWGSTLVLKLIDRFPVVITFGAALLGWIAGGMLITDVLVVDQFGAPSQAFKLAAEAAGAILIVVVGKWLAARQSGSPA